MTYWMKAMVRITSNTGPKLHTCKTNKISLSQEMVVSGYVKIKNRRWTF